MGQQYLQVYGVPGAVNSPVYQYGQLSQTIPSGHGYTAVQGYSVPGSHVLQLGGPTVSAMTTSSMAALQAPYPSGTFCCLILFSDHSNLKIPGSIPSKAKFMCS